MLHALGETFHTFTLEQARVVLKPSFIVEQNSKLGYGTTGLGGTIMLAQWLWDHVRSSNLPPLTTQMVQVRRLGGFAALHMIIFLMRSSAP
jgi:hypothetical protein